VSEAFYQALVIHLVTPHVSAKKKKNQKDYAFWH